MNADKKEDHNRAKKRKADLLLCFLYLWILLSYLR
jgi:hypothetical protein